MTDYTPQLQEAIQRLADLIQLLRPLIDPTPEPGSCSSSASSSSTRLFAYHPPIIDTRTGPWVSDEPLGLRKYVDSLDTHLALLQVTNQSKVAPNEDPLPNVLGAITFAKQMLIAPTPLVGVKVMLSSQSKAAQDFANGAAMGGGRGGRVGKKRQKGDKDEGFVDIVARGGQEWIRLYSKKVGHLLSEFREQDSYLNSDFDSDSDLDDSETNGTNGKDGRSTPPLTNSLITMVDDLLALAEMSALPPGARPPSLTIRITRIEEHPEGGHEDDRIDATFDAIRAKSVNLLFGDLDDTPLRLLETVWADKPLRPAKRINLDPTALLGICSDLLHHPLPSDEEEAKRRFFRPEECLMSGREGRQGNEGSGGWKGQSQNSRELVKGVMDEIEHPLIEEIRDTLAQLGEDVEFWATEEAVTHVKEALGSEDVVGDGMEQMRMRRLVGLEDGDFFEGSRYQGKAGCLQGIKINVFPPEGPDGLAPLSGSVRPRQLQGMTSFHATLSAVCHQFLSEYYTVLDNPHSPEARALPSFLHPRRLPVPKVAQLSRPFPIVSLHSFARGASEGMTTLTMGSVVFRELWTQPRWKPKGWHQGNYELESGAAEGGEKGRGNAAIWMLPYRCMGEGKRVKFEKGDFSYPT